jgi:hypothetical protein
MGQMSVVDFQKLKGRWVRPDGGYVIEITEVSAEGRMEARYFNPMPIAVSRAEAVQEDDALRVFIELQAPGYPGSTYDLKYDPVTNRLRGVYHQAAIKQDFDVVFIRLRQ